MPNRNRFLYDIEWLTVKGGLDWSRWAYVQGGFERNFETIRAYFAARPIWARAYRAWRLLHQVAGFTGAPEAKAEEKHWQRVMKELDLGLRVEVEAVGDTTSHLKAGMTAGELRALRKAMVRPDWRYNPEIVRLKGELNGHLTSRA